VFFVEEALVQNGGLSATILAVGLGVYHIAAIN